MPGDVFRSWRVWLLATGAWLAPSIVFATQAWTHWRTTGKAMSWWAAWLYQAPSWLLLIPATPVILWMVRTHPLSRQTPRRLALHAGAAIAFGFLFLAIATPIRHLFHPSPVRWTFFGEALAKSAPQFIVMGAGAYALLVLIGSLLETRERVAEAPDLGASPTPPVPTSIVLDGVAGVLSLSPGDIIRAETSASGARIVTTDETYTVRHTLAEIEARLAAHGFARTHRAHLVAIARVRELLGGRGREGHARLDTGETIPVSRRRREALEAALRGEQT